MLKIKVITHDGRVYAGNKLTVIDYYVMLTDYIDGKEIITGEIACEWIKSIEII
jgi:hypothetical protein